MRGLLIACAKRSITPEQLDLLITDIENELRSLPKGEFARKTSAISCCHAWPTLTTWHIYVLQAYIKILKALKSFSRSN